MRILEKNNNGERVVFEKGDKWVCSVLIGSKDEYIGGYSKDDAKYEFVVRSEDINKYFKEIDGDLEIRECIEVSLIECADERKMYDELYLSNVESVLLGELGGIKFYVA